MLGPGSPLMEVVAQGEHVQDAVLPGALNPLEWTAFASSEALRCHIRVFVRHSWTDGGSDMNAGRTKICGPPRQAGAGRQRQSTGSRGPGALSGAAVGD